MAERNAFYDHLDECGRCRNRPFGLCHVGAKLLQEQATNIDVAGLAASVNQDSLQRSGHAPTDPCETCGGTKLIQKNYADGSGFYSRKCPTCRGTGRRQDMSPTPGEDR